MLEAVRALDEIRTCRPRKVMHIILHITMSGAAARIGTRLLDARRTDRPARGHGNPHVVAAEVGKEFGVGEKLPGHPARLIEHPELGEPLHGKEVVADLARAIEVLRKTAGPCHAHAHRLARRHPRGQVGRGERSIVAVLIVGRDVAEARHHVRLAAVGVDQRHRRNRRIAEVLFRGVGEGVVAGKPPLLHPGRVRIAERIPIHVQPHRIRRDLPGVSPRDHFGAGQRSRGRVQRDVDVVPGNVRRQLRGRAACTLRLRLRARRLVRRCLGEGGNLGEGGGGNGRNREEGEDDMSGESHLVLHRRSS